MTAALTATHPNLADTGQERGRETFQDRMLRWSLIGLAVPGFITLPNGGWPPVNVAAVLYGIVAVMAALAYLGPAGRTSQPPGVATWYVIGIGYPIVKTVLMLLGPHPAGTGDWIQGYKAYLLLPAVAYFLCRSCFTTAGVARTMRWLLPIFAVKYVLASTVGDNPRPVVWVENNFELMALLGLFYLAWPALGRRRGWWVVVLAGVVLLSQSRSSILELGLVLLVIFWRPSDRKFLLYVVAGGLVTAVGYRVFAARTQGGLTGTDRHQFQSVFTVETAHFTPLEWLFGTFPLAPLSSASCQRLSYYSSLFSQTDPDRCYSVILHSFVFRVLFDQGVVGTTLLLVFLGAALAQSGASTRDRVAILGIGCVNAISVSAFNSEYMSLVLVVAVALVRHPAPTRDDPDGTQVAGKYIRTPATTSSTSHTGASSGSTART